MKVGPVEPELNIIQFSTERIDQIMVLYGPNSDQIMKDMLKNDEEIMNNHE